MSVKRAVIIIVTVIFVLLVVGFLWGIDVNAGGSSGGTGGY